MSNKTILVTGPDLHPNAKKLAQEFGYETVHTPAYADSEVISECLEKTGAQAIVSRMGQLSEDVISSAPQLRVISKHGVGVDNIDLDAAAARGIPVLVATGANAVSVAEHAIALMLTCIKKIVPLDASLHEGKWEKSGFIGREIDGATLGLFGMGSIAQAVGRIARGLNLNIVGYDPFADQIAFENIGAKRFDDLGEMLQETNILSLHAPLNRETHNIINAETIAKLPKGSYIINTARGGLIDEAALIAAIQSEHLAGAGLDTFAVEPPAKDHPFFNESRIVLTPHIGGVTREAGARVGSEAIRGIIQILNGEPVAPQRIANRKQLAEKAEKFIKSEEA